MFERILVDNIKHALQGQDYAKLPKPTVEFILSPRKLGNNCQKTPKGLWHSFFISVIETELELKVLKASLKLMENFQIIV